jgi:hypothetical protein
MPESGATGELRVEGGTVFVRTTLDMRFESFRASRSSKLSLVGSEGSFSIFAGDLLANHPSATISFTADAAGVTPIVVGGRPSPAGDFNDNGFVDAADYTVWRDTLGSTTDLRANDDNMGGSAGVVDQADYALWKTNFGNEGERFLSIADIQNGNLELDLNAYNFTPESRLVLIEAPADEFGGLVLGEFGNVMFLGNTTATVNYDMVNGDVYLDNFQRPAGSAAAVPEPSSLVAAVVLMACLAAQSRCRWTRN